MNLRIVALTVLCTAGVGCSSEDAPVGSIDFQITRVGGPGENDTLHIDPAGLAARNTLADGTQLETLDPATLTALHDQVDAARFATLAPKYVCTGLCPDIASDGLQVTVQLADRPYTVATDVYWLQANRDRIPAGFVATVDALQAIFNGTGWLGDTKTLVDFRITGGFGGPSFDTTLHIGTTGAATRTPSHAAPVTTQLDAAALAALDAQIRDAQFPALAPSYGCLGCADEQVYEISVALDGVQYQVSVDSEFYARGPQGLLRLVATLHQLAQPAGVVD